LKKAKQKKVVDTLHSDSEAYGKCLQKTEIWDISILKSKTQLTNSISARWFQFTKKKDKKDLPNDKKIKAGESENQNKTDRMY